MLRLFSSIIIVINVAFAHSGNHLKCGKNEILSKCENRVCEYRKCSDVGQPIECEKVDRKNCIKGCICRNNYLRANNGTCIPEDQCPSSCGKNEIPTSCIEEINERRSCSDLSESVSCVQVDRQFCTDGCICEDGFLRNCNEICIPIDECPEAQCGDNEEFDLCPETCPGEECGVDPSLVNCLPSPEPGSSSCQPSCRCCDGYRRNTDGCCIPEDDCPPQIICGPDEEYNSCVNGNYCGRRNCSQPAICIDLIEGGCIEGCQCKEGLLRADNGTCIPEDQCPPNCFGENEVAGCQRNCPPQTCESIGRMYKCSERPVECIQECRCIPGYYRNAIDECVSKADCLKCPGPNEYFSCGGGCDNVCANLTTQNQTNCPIVNIVSNPMCYCIEGYARDSNNTCIPISKCPPPQPPNEVECGSNAVYDSNCTESCPECPPQDCDICLRVLCEPIQDPPGCRCVKNYLRNRKGFCVPSEQCDPILKRRPSKRRNQIVSNIRG